MMNKIYEIFQEGFSSGYFRRIDHNNSFGLYVGKNTGGHFSFEYSGKFSPVRVKSSDLIKVEHFKDGEMFTICFSLETNDLLERFCIFCQDLVDSVQDIKNVNDGYRMICDRFFSWKKLFKPSQGNLTEPEIMGLIGELIFLNRHMLPFINERDAIDSWMGPEKTHKDFSYMDTWVEVKTIGSGKDSVRISSIEQLDSREDGTLVVYQLELMAITFNGITLNKLVNDTLSIINNQFCKDKFIDKLEAYGYDWSPDYDNRVYDVVDESMYHVGENFPRLKREDLSVAIGRVQYEIMLAEIEQFKNNTLWS